MINDFYCNACDFDVEIDNTNFTPGCIVQCRYCKTYSILKEYQGRTHSDGGHLFWSVFPFYGVPSTGESKSEASRYDQMSAMDEFEPESYNDGAASQ